ncbi:hypothetical protein IQ260_06245 [Leptolyngbya cf. ectocarpi LEGE 11479]|uniref:Calcium-binding protein n=2 Tax=Leptolyngbya ectocarpi TaxID=1202 RepID=A0A928X471_LEPEC|nr:hypothetical protein [Leptolyngbya cf. ectocarpi LEGE 11479]
MNPSIKGRFSSLDQADLLPDDIQTIVQGYGSGKGSVKPLGGSPTPPPKPPTSSNKAVIRGTVGADTLIGGSNSQRIVGKRGNDVINGKGGNDKLIGDHGNDRLLGGSGNDQLLGGANNDQLLGGTGNDTLLGGDGNDILQGAWRRRSAEKDVMTGGRGRDTFVLGNESGTLYDDGNAKSKGTKNYALITDLNVSQGDIIQLSDNYNYRLGSSPKGVDSGRALFIDNGAGQQDELIAVIRGASNLNLNSSTFNLV